MPKAIQYQKGSIIYFENDNDDKIFILQSGVVILSSTDIEFGNTITTQLSQGEFFGTKSALGHFPREETVTVLETATVICMTVQEFESIFANNKQVVYKMLRVFSGQLREMHKRTNSLLSPEAEFRQDDGMFNVAKAFFRAEKFRSCMDVCVKYLKRFPNAAYKDTVAKLFEQSASLDQKQKSKSKRYYNGVPEMMNKELAQFSLPAFERFQQTYEPNQVIISEYEPGDSFYLIQSGEIQLIKCVNDSLKNLDILKPGEFFGEMAILDNSPRSATCMAIGEVQCLEFNKANFELLVTANPQIALILLKLFCKRIYDQKRRFKNLIIKDPQARIADVLCMFDEMNPCAKPIEKQRTLNLTLKDIAQWSGLPLNIVQDEMEKLSSKRKVEIFENYITVSNIMEIKHIVEMKNAQKRLTGAVENQ